MGKLKKVTRQLSIRLAEDVARAVADMSAEADWSESKTINHLSRIGFAAHAGDALKVREAIEAFDLESFARQVRSEADARIRAARASSRPDPDQMTLDQVLAAAPGIPEREALDCLSDPTDAATPRELAADLDAALDAIEAGNIPGEQAAPADEVRPKASKARKRPAGKAKSKKGGR